jgi:hypothetical protein
MSLANLFGGRAETKWAPLLHDSSPHQREQQDRRSRAGSLFTKFSNMSEGRPEGRRDHRRPRFLHLFVIHHRSPSPFRRRVCRSPRSPAQLPPPGSGWTREMTESRINRCLKSDFPGRCTVAPLRPGASISRAPPHPWSTDASPRICQVRTALHDSSRHR